MSISSFTTYKRGGALNSVSNVFADIPGLSDTMPAGSSVLFEIYVPALTSGGIGGAAFQVVVPAGFTLYSLGGVILNQAANTLEFVCQDNTGTGIFTTLLGFPAGYALFHVKGIITNASPGGGTIKVQASQSNTDAANPLNIATGESWMVLKFVG